MPNWASLTYKIVAKKEEDLKPLKDAFKLMEEKPFIKNGFGNMWLGNLVTILGGDWEKVSCRGYVTDYEFRENILTMYAEWAWWQSDDFLPFLREKLSDDVDIYYIGEEPGCECFYTNDEKGVCFDEKYLLDWNFNKSEGYEYFPDLVELQKYIAEHIFTLLDAELRKKIDFSDCDDDNMPCTFYDICELLQKIEEETDDDDCYFSIHEFKYSDD